MVVEVIDDDDDGGGDGDNDGDDGDDDDVHLDNPECKDKPDSKVGGHWG